MPKLTILLPARNEEENLTSLIPETVRELEKLEPDFELLIINDASTDQTLRIAEEISSKDLRIKVLDNKIWKGLGHVIKLGLRNAKGDFILCFLPADSFPPKFIKNLYDSRNRADVIVGTRPSLKETGIKRILISRVFKILNRFVTGLTLKDYSWVHLYNRRVFEKVDVVSDGVFFAVEILAKAKKQEFKIIEVETGFRKREKGKTKTANIGVIFTTIKEMLKLKSQI